MLDTEKPSTILDLSLDIKYVILDYLDNRSLAYLAQACKYFGMLVRNVLSFRNAQVSTIEHLMPKSPPFLNYRAGVAVGSTFYIPFINDSPFCYAFDLNTKIWTSHKLNLIDMNELQPQITSAAVVGNKIYLVGGRLLKSYTLSNGLIEIDVTNFDTRMISDVDGMPPRPRHEHSVDAVGNRYLVVFGGLCYNSVGENDVFVYDIFDNRWFVPPISGHVPHLRFGHASTAIGNNLYIHGGAQLDNDSSYIVYDDLYKLDCQTWVWYKYEHPEVEKYLRNQLPTPGAESPQRNNLISTTGDSPYDRFQSYMCSYGNKLIIFGGHSIREDEDENEILCSYPVDELSIFNTKRSAWTTMRATSVHGRRRSDDLCNEEEEDEGEEAITLSDMSAATIPMNSRGIRIFIFAGKKAAEIPRSNIIKAGDRSYNSSKNTTHSSSSNDSGHSRLEAPSQQYGHFLPSITETASPTLSAHSGDESNQQNRTDSGEVVAENEKSRSEETAQGEIRTPNESDHSDQVKQLFRQEPDMDYAAATADGDQMMVDGMDGVDTIIDSAEPMMDGDEDEEILNSSNYLKPSSKSSKKKLKRRRPSISVIHHDHNATNEDGGSSSGHVKNTSSSSHSSFSSTGSLGNRKSRHQRKVIPCTVLLDLIE